MRKAIGSTVLVLGVLLALGSVCNATNYYVSADGNDGNSGFGPDPSQAWRTFTKAITTAKGGDTVHFRTGNYSGGDLGYNRSLGGSDASGYLILKPYQDEVPVITSFVRLWRSHYIKIQNFKWTSGIMLHSGEGYNTNIEITGNYFSGRLSFYQGVISVSGRNILVENNRLDLTPSGSTNDHGIYIMAGQLQYTYSDNIVVRGNVVSGVTGYLIHLYDEWKNTWEVREITNTIIENNYVYNSTARSGILAAVGNQTTINGVIISNNVIYNVGWHGIAGIYGNSATIKNLEIYNNTIYNYGSYGIEMGSSVDGAIIKNNIIDDTVRGGSQIRNSGKNVTAAYNLYPDGTPNNYGIADTQPVGGNPRFADPAYGDFSLQPDSAAIDKGVAIASVLYDVIGTARPQEHGYDIGAYEYRGEKGDSPASDPEAPNAPRNLVVRP